VPVVLALWRKTIPLENRPSTEPARKAKSGRSRVNLWHALKELELIRRQSV
jgi:hypothetical protein